MGPLMRVFTGYFFLLFYDTLIFCSSIWKNVSTIDRWIIQKIEKFGSNQDGFQQKGSSVTLHFCFFRCRNFLEQKLSQMGKFSTVFHFVSLNFSERTLSKYFVNKLSQNDNFINDHKNNKKEIDQQWAFWNILKARNYNIKM